MNIMTKLQQAEYLVKNNGECDIIICHDCFIHDVSKSKECDKEECVRLAKEYIDKVN